MAKIGVIGMRMRDHHRYYNRKSPKLEDIFTWQEKQLQFLAKQGHTFLIGCADHWDCRAMKWLFYNGYADQIQLILPFPGFGSKQGKDWRTVRQQLELREQATYLHQQATSDEYQMLNQRNRTLIKESDWVLWLWDGSQKDAYSHLIVNMKPGYAFPWKEYVASHTQLV